MADEAVHAGPRPREEPARATLTPRQELALATINREPTEGVGIWIINPMEWRMIDRLAGVPEGTYREDPVATYRTMLQNSGVCMVDQWIPTNPLSMTDTGYESDTPRGATTAAAAIEVDGIAIHGPEEVVEHMESKLFPALRRAIANFDREGTIQSLLDHERREQEEIGPQMLKVPYGCASFPAFMYGIYGYAPYFTAYALYPEIMEEHFRLGADLALLQNEAVAEAFVRGNLPPMIRLDHDMADTRGTLVDIRSLDAIWFPHFARCLQPLLSAGVKLIWHCDGNLMAMVPRLLDVGLQGFQGFEYQHGMDYEAICKMKTRDGEPLLIIAGVSVTQSLPLGSPEDVRRELRWLVEKGPPQGLFLACSSSITPGVPWENLQALTEGFNHYLKAGR